MNSSKKWTNEFVFTTMRRVFIHFWKKLKTPKRHLKIIWPLVTLSTWWILMWYTLQRYWLYLASQKILVSCKGVFPKKNKETNNQGQVRKKSYQSILPQKSIKFSSNEDKWRNNKLRQKIVILNHSMARANLNKSKKVLTSTTTASKYIPMRPRVCINWNPPFQTSL